MKGKYLASIMDALEKPPPKVDQSPLRGSQVGQCARSMFAQMLGLEPKPLTAKTQRIFDTGTDAGIRLANKLKLDLDADPKPEVLLEVPVYSSVPVARDANKILEAVNKRWPEQDGLVSMGGAIYVRSRLDILIDYPGSNDKVVIDFKTKEPFGFELMAEGKRGVDEQYVAQVGVQILGLMPRSAQSLEAYVIYMNKGTQDLLPMQLDYDEAVKAGKARLQVMGELLDALAMGDNLDAANPEHATSALAAGKSALPFQCNYCKYSPVDLRCTGDVSIYNASTTQIPKWKIGSKR